jgi:pimeloyl-ACP methyl ester carboxylesterase
MTQTIELDIDVAEVTPFSEARVALTVYLPDEPAPRPAVVFGYAGGSYRKEYYDVLVEGHGTSYSVARHVAARGHYFVACDHLGMGASSTPTPARELTWEVMAAADDAAAREVARRLADGTLAADVGPVEARLLVGGGHSMGGCILTVTQARHRTFDAVAILGWSAIGTVLPTAGTKPAFRPDRIPRPDGYFDLVKDERMEYVYHRPDVPADVVAAVRQLDSRQPPCVAEGKGGMLGAGVVRDEAASIDVPVLVACGEFDVVPDSHAEAAAYRRSRDVTVFELAGAAHLFNFASRRAEFFDRLVGWAESLATTGKKGLD